MNEFEITKEMLYRCYSPNLMKFALSEGCKYLFIGIDILSGKKFWIFQKNSNFINSLDKWESTKPKKLS